MKEGWSLAIVAVWIVQPGRTGFLPFGRYAGGVGKRDGRDERSTRTVIIVGWVGSDPSLDV